jgi:hypothetical protein
MPDLRYAAGPIEAVARPDELHMSIASQADQHPESGLRVLFELQTAHEDHAIYAASLFTPDQGHRFTVAIHVDGTIRVEDSDSDSDESAIKNLRKFAMTIARQSVSNRKDGLPPWPRRVLRWRPA